MAAAAKAAAAAPKRPKNEIVGSGVLHHELAAAAVASKLAIKNLTVLSPQNDPYWFDTKVGHENGQWFKDQVERLVGPTDRFICAGCSTGSLPLATSRSPPAKCSSTPTTIGSG